MSNPDDIEDLKLAFVEHEKVVMALVDEVKRLQQSNADLLVEVERLKETKSNLGAYCENMSHHLDHDSDLDTAWRIVYDIAGILNHKE